MLGGVELIYKATTIRVVQFSFFLLIMLLIFQNKADYPWMLYYLIPLAIVLLSTIFMNYKLKISNGTLTFQIRIFSVSFYNKAVSHKEITSMKFKRAGWGKKCVIVKNHKGFNFRITNFNPETIYNDLNNFATDYEIPIYKTKDYLILEK